MLASYAELTPDGSLSIIRGGLDAFFSTTGFPVTLGLPIYLALRLSFSPEECGKNYRTHVEIVSPAGDVIEQSDHDVAVSLPPDGSDRLKTTIVIAFCGVVIPAVGKYTLRILLDDREIRSLPMQFNNSTSPSGQGA
jgi:hypothetical protein